MTGRRDMGRMGRAELMSELLTLRAAEDRRRAPVPEPCPDLLVSETAPQESDAGRLDFLDGDWAALVKVTRRGFRDPTRSIRSLIDEERRRAAEEPVRVDPRASMPRPDLLVGEGPDDPTSHGGPAAPPMTEHVVDALAWLLLRIGGWTHSAFTSHVRSEFGDEVGDELEAWLTAAGVSAAVRGIGSLPASESVSAWRFMVDPKRRESSRTKTTAPAPPALAVETEPDPFPWLPPAERNARAAVLRIGGCAHLDRKRGRICIQKVGHGGACFEEEPDLLSPSIHDPACASYDFDPDVQLGPDRPCDCGATARKAR